MSSRLLHPWDFSGKNTGVGCHLPSPGDLPNLGIQSMPPVSPALQADSVPTEPSEKPLKNVSGHCQISPRGQKSLDWEPLPQLFLEINSLFKKIDLYKTEIEGMTLPRVSRKIAEVPAVAAAAAKSLQSCPTLCKPMDCSPPGSPVPGILQARTLEWAALCSTIYLLIPNSKLIPLPAFPFGNHKFVFYVCESVSVL